MRRLGSLTSESLAKPARSGYGVGEGVRWPGGGVRVAGGAIVGRTLGSGSPEPDGLGLGDGERVGDGDGEGLGHGSDVLMFHE